MTFISLLQPFLPLLPFQPAHQLPTTQLACSHAANAANAAMIQLPVNPSTRQPVPVSQSTCPSPVKFAGVHVPKYLGT